MSVERTEEMTLRDQFAVAAVQGILASGAPCDDDGRPASWVYFGGEEPGWAYGLAPQWISEMAYDIADAMLAQRKK